MNLGRENEVLEFKETTRELTEAIIDIVAILNKHNRGTLYFGVKNNGDVLGFQIGDSTERDISRKIFERIKPQIFPEIETDINNKIVKVSFQGVERPYSADGRYYIRVSDESREMSPQELTRMIMEVNYKSWEKQITDNSINDVDEINLKKFLDSAIKSKRLPYMEYNKIELLNKLNLLSEDKKWLNNAGRYLFSNKKPIQLKMAVFATNEKRSFIDISTSDGNIFELVEDAEKYILDFGKHAGKPLQDLPTSYLHWLYDNNEACRKMIDILGLIASDEDIEESTETIQEILTLIDETGIDLEKIKTKYEIKGLTEATKEQLKEIKETLEKHKQIQEKTND